MKSLTLIVGIAFVATAALISGMAKSVAEESAPPADPFVTCIQELANDPQFDGLAKKLSIHDLSNIPFSMLADNTLATPQERKDLLAWFDKRDQCWKDSEPLHQKQWPPDIFHLAQEGGAALHNIGLDLYNRKITFGEANKRLQDFAVDASARLAVMIKRYQDEIAAQKEAAAQQERQTQENNARLSAQQRANEEAQYAQQQAIKQQRMQMFLNYWQATRPPPLQVPQMRPTYNTNCTTSGNMTNCTTN